MRLLQAHIDTLWTADEHGLLVGSNEPEPEPAPRVFAGRDAQGVVIRAGHRLPGRAREALLDLSPAAVFDARDAILQLLATDEECTRIWEGPAYHWVDPTEEESCSLARLLGADDLQLLDAFAALQHGKGETLLLQAPLSGVVVDGTIVALCHSSRVGTVANEAGIETLPAYRRRGYGRQAVRMWAQAVQAQGKIALYSTNWDNAASCALAASLGLRQYAATIGYY